jgi:hypothetical protein
MDDEAEKQTPGAVSAGRLATPLWRSMRRG